MRNSNCDAYQLIYLYDNRVKEKSVSMMVNMANSLIFKEDMLV